MVSLEDVFASRDVATQLPGAKRFMMVDRNG